MNEKLNMKEEVLRKHHGNDSERELVIGILELGRLSESFSRHGEYEEERVECEWRITILKRILEESREGK
jgi:hypothetical protein